MNKARTLIVSLLVVLVLSALSSGAVYAQDESGPERTTDWVTVAAAAIGVEEAALRDALAAGQTIAEVAEENGVDPQTVIDAIVAAETENLTEQVADFVQGQAERPRFRFEFIPMPSMPQAARFQFFQPGRSRMELRPFDEGFPFFEWRVFMRPMMHRMSFPMGYTLLDSVAEAIGIEPEALLEALADGKSIAEVAEEHNVDSQAVTDAILASAWLDEAVEDGWLPENQAGWVREHLLDRMELFVLGGFSPRWSGHCHRHH